MSNSNPKDNFLPGTATTVFPDHIEPKVSKEELKRQDGRGMPNRSADPDHGKCKGSGINRDDGTYCNCRYVTD